MRAHSFYVTLLLALSACGGRVHGSQNSGSASDAGTGVGARACAFKGFAPSVSYSAAKEPFELTAIDSAGAGHLDLMVGEWTNGLTDYQCELFANAGDGTFASQPSFGANDNSCANLISADFDGDGKVDLANQPSSSDGSDADSSVLGIDFGVGPHAFAPTLTQYPLLRAGNELVAGDFDGDGQPDIAAAGFNIVESCCGGLPEPVPGDAALEVLLNTGRGELASPVLYPNPHLLGELVTGDFNGDGRLDIVSLTNAVGGSFDVYLNAGRGTFQDAQTVITSAASAYGVGVADFDGDGKSDVATTTSLAPNQPAQQAALQIFSGRSDGGFDGPVNYSIPTLPSFSQVRTGDFNGDGKPDVAMVSVGASQGVSVNPVSVAVFLNQGDGTFGSATNYFAGNAAVSYVVAIAVGDFNGDGASDIALTTANGEAPAAQAVDVLLSECQ